MKGTQRNYLAKIVLRYVDNLLRCSRALDWRIGIGKDRIALTYVTQAIVDMLRILWRINGAHSALGCGQCIQQARYLMGGRGECVNSLCS